MKIDFSTFNKDILKALQNNAKKVIQSNYKKLRSSIKPIIVDAIYDCPEMVSVRSGKLKYDFGLDFDPTLLIAWSVGDSMKLSYSYPPNAIFKFYINIQPVKYDNLLSLKEAYIQTENDTLPWLEWLLLYGTSPIIYDFGVLYKEGEGRSGGAIMVQNHGVFMVDPSYSGTSEDNFIVRALNKKLPEIQQTAWQTLLI